ncbi:hypothetical protein ACJMQP_04185 [Rhodopseudomonas palustris]
MSETKPFQEGPFLALSEVSWASKHFCAVEISESYQSATQLGASKTQLSYMQVDGDAVPGLAPNGLFFQQQIASPAVSPKVAIKELVTPEMRARHNMWSYEPWRRDTTYTNQVLAVDWDTVYANVAQIIKAGALGGVLDGGQIANAESIFGSIEAWADAVGRSMVGVCISEFDYFDRESMTFNNLPPFFITNTESNWVDPNCFMGTNQVGWVWYDLYSFVYFSLGSFISFFWSPGEGDPPEETVQEAMWHPVYDYLSTVHPELKTENTYSSELRNVLIFNLDKIKRQVKGGGKKFKFRIEVEDKAAVYPRAVTVKQNLLYRTDDERNMQWRLIDEKYVIDAQGRSVYGSSGSFDVTVDLKDYKITIESDDPGGGPQ